MLVSKGGLASIFLFILFLMLFRLVLPYGDEPDFLIKVDKLKLGDDISLVGALSKDLLGLYESDVSCNIRSAPLSLSASISGRGCHERVGIKILRVLSTLLAVLPLLVVVVFHQKLSSYLYFKVWDERRYLFSFRVLSLATVLPFSGFLYYVSLLSVEQLTLVLTLLGFVFIDRKVIVLFTLILAFSLDAGNAIVAASFFFVYYIFSFLNRRYGFMVMVSFVVSGVAVAAFLGLFLVGFLSAYSAKAAAIYYVLTEGSQAQLIDKYPLVFRPLMTLASFVLYTPSYLKAPLGYLLVFVVGVIALFKRPGQRFLGGAPFASEALVYFCSAIFVILCFTLSLPTYATGKYYVFLLPALFCFLLVRFGFWRVLVFSSSVSILSLFHVSYYYLV